MIKRGLSLVSSNLFAVIQYLQEQEDIHLEVKARKVAKGAVNQC